MTIYLISIFIIILIKKEKKKLTNLDASLLAPEVEISDGFEGDAYASFDNHLRDEVPENDPFDRLHTLN